MFYKLPTNTVIKLEYVYKVDYFDMRKIGALERLNVLKHIAGKNNSLAEIYSNNIEKGDYDPAYRGPRYYIKPEFKPIYDKGFLVVICLKDEANLSTECVMCDTEEEALSFISVFKDELNKT